MPEAKDNAPNAQPVSPYGTITSDFQNRCRMHVATILGTSGGATIVLGQSSPIIRVNYLGTGDYEILFPPGGPDAIGWILCSPFQVASPSKLVQSFSLPDFVNGSVHFNALDLGLALADFEGLMTVCVFTITNTKQP